MATKKLLAIIGAMIAGGLGIAAVSSSVQAAQAAKTNQCGISGLVHQEQQQVGGVKGGKFGQAVGEFNGNAHGSKSFQGSTDRNTPRIAKECSDK
jgi:hypothetical protein